MPLELHASHLLLYQMNITIDVHVPQKKVIKVFVIGFFSTRNELLTTCTCFNVGT